jgi:phosphoadenosine phosphosulfate reductase
VKASPDAATGTVAARAAALAAIYGETGGVALLDAMIRKEFTGGIALVSSFGTEAAVLLHMVAAVDPRTPVIFLDTGKLFGETRRYRDELVARLRLKDVRIVTPDPVALARRDPDGTLWFTNPDACCGVRKVEPLARALEGLSAWINGRKRYQGDLRSLIPTIEAAEGRVKINPLAHWRRAEIDAYFERHELPHHPLQADGFQSVGCIPCSERSRPDEDARAGRWRGLDKTECGIHLPAPDRKTAAA